MFKFSHHSVDFKDIQMREIFKKEPSHWGLRGDPHLWHELENYMSSAKQPENEQEFENLIKEAFKILTGEELAPNKEVFIKRYDSGGMSSGFVDTNFWMKVGFVLLKERFAKFIHHK